MWGRVCADIYIDVLARTLLYICADILGATIHLYGMDFQYDNLYIYDQYVHRCTYLYIGGQIYTGFLSRH